MKTPGAHAGVLTALVVAGLAAPCAVSAQSGFFVTPPPAGFYVTPSLSIAEVYDDNLFSSPDRREQDLISRFTPRLELGYRSTPFTLLGRYDFDADIYVDHPELTNAQARQEASMRVEARPNPLLRLAVAGIFQETDVASELNVETGLAVERTRARRVSLRPSFDWQLDRLTTASLEATATQDEVLGGLTSRAYTADARLERRLTRRDRGSLGYAVRRFEFDADDTITSHIAVLGWTHEFTPLTSVTLRAGPRFSEGATDQNATDLEASAALRHRLTLGELALTYTRSEFTVVGVAGTFDTESLTALLAYEPVRRLQLRATPGVFRARSDAGEAMVYAVGLEAAYRITKWLSLEGVYRYSLQQGSVFFGASEDVEISRNIVLLRLTLTYPYRVR